MGKSKTTRPATGRRRKARPTAEPTHHDLLRRPDITTAVAVRFSCGVYLRVTHPDYGPAEVIALLGQGQVQLEPLAPGHVGALILDGFPYTVLGYYTFSAVDADLELAPVGWTVHGTAKNQSRRTTRKRRTDRARPAKRRRQE
jgi:hypothetical protein